MGLTSTEMLVFFIYVKIMEEWKMKNTIKYDCFANRISKYEKVKNLKLIGCSILTEMICLERKCPFYKTKDEYTKSLNN